MVSSDGGAAVWSGRILFCVMLMAVIVICDMQQLCGRLAGGIQQAHAAMILIITCPCSVYRRMTALAAAVSAAETARAGCALGRDLGADHERMVSLMRGHAATLLSSLTTPASSGERMRAS